MGKKNRRASAGPGRCVHCLEEVSVRNWDHVLPESWYPETTPPNTEKWVVPTCIACNSEYGRIEQSLLIRLGLCLDPYDPETQAITQKAMRSLNPNVARDRRDRRARERKRDKILEEITRYDITCQIKGNFPNFGPERFPGTRELSGLKISKLALEKLTEKIVRGVSFIQSGLYIDDRYELVISFMENAAAHPIIQMIQRYGHLLTCGPGISVLRAVIPEEQECGLYAVEIWKQVRLYAAVTPRGGLITASHLYLL